MTGWQPRRGERIIAVLPDGHEIEGEYDFYSAPCGLADPPGYGPVHVVVVGEPDHRETVAVRTVKPLPVPEPTAPLARIIDGDGVKWYREPNGWWYSLDVGEGRPWADLRQPVTVIDADPNWEAK